MKDLTIIYYTANKIPDTFARNVIIRLRLAIGDTPVISLSKKPIDFGKNIVFDQTEASYLNIYAEVLEGVKQAQTKYVALAEDDTLYTEEHFRHRPTPGRFAYNIACWTLFTWVHPAVYSYKGRRNNNGLICERDLYIACMEERFAKYKDKQVDLSIWGEPGKYEEQLGVTIHPTEEFYTGKPNIMFNHETGSSFQGLGKRKRLGQVRAYDIPYWRHAEDIVKLYE